MGRYDPVTSESETGRHEGCLPVRPATAWVWTGMVAVGTLVLGVVGGFQGALDAEMVGLLLLSPLYVALGLLIVVRQNRNRVSWILFIVGTWVVLEGAAELRIDDRPDPASVWDLLAIIWLNTGFFSALVIPIFLLLYIFPTGRFLTRRWMWAGWVAGIISSIAVFVAAFAKEVPGPDGEGWTITNPIGFLEYEGLGNAGALGFVFGIGLVGLMVGGIPAIVVRYRRSDGLVRTQIKWVVYALLVMAIMFISRIVFNLVADPASTFLFVFALMIVPSSVAIAITRYRLYDIDRIISRTLSYAIVVGLLATAFFGSVTMVTSLLPTQNALAVAASTLAVAGLFNPLRKQVQGWVDRRFNRSRYDSERVMAKFVESLQDRVDPKGVAQGWVSVVVETMKPSTVALWVKKQSR